MRFDIHGTRIEPNRKHPVFDIAHWEKMFPLRDQDRVKGECIDDPEGLAGREQAIRRVKARGELGAFVPADVFVWASRAIPERPWLTRMGGNPWRPKGKPWPCDREGIPLAFLGQICFADSEDILPCKLPGDVALIFGTNHCGWVSIDEGAALEWSPLTINEPEDGMGIPWTGRLPYEYHGVIHRTVQYTDWKAAEPVFEAAGYKAGGWGVGGMQATSIGVYADLPQGWPFEEGDGNELIATMSSFYFGETWPLVDIPHCLQRVDGDGRVDGNVSASGYDFGVGDVGSLWIYRDSAGAFKLDGACG